MGDDGAEVPQGLDAGAKISATWYQPKSAKTYSGLPRFQAKDTVTASANGLGAEAESWDKSLPCLGATLSGASTLLAGAVISFGLAALI